MTGMTLPRAMEVCKAFAKKHDVEFRDQGEVGFGRPCVGFLRGNRYIDIHPYNNQTLEEIWPRDIRLAAPNGVAAYHKHDCLAVLAETYEMNNDSWTDYGSAIIQLARWVEHLEGQGEVEIVQYPTGATGLQVMISGVLGNAVRFKAPAGV